MTIEAPTIVEGPEDSPISVDGWVLQWTPIVAGALFATALSSILVTFAAAVGLGVSSASPSWRDASVALWLLSGLYLILLALVSFGCGGYIAGRARLPYEMAETGEPEEVEKRDGLHGLSSWALAIVLGAALAALIGTSASKPTALATPAGVTEPSVLSYELDQLFRAPRRAANGDLAPQRAEAGRILMTSSGHDGVSSDDRAYLIQMVTATTGLSGTDAEHRVDNVIADAHKAISRTRAATIILAFSVATALLLGAVAAWTGAAAGGRHRDGMPLPGWMSHANRFHTRRTLWREPATPKV
ncbi:hypothetical protein [Bradyrhizobium sp.]|uniref:hypothetical protein n=1 Tax=Bradyrhizobium sp. TaxID=376 RepID=UPI0025C46B16|nr:hypothetical protein [Bradyrhizobium sp.]